MKPQYVAAQGSCDVTHDAATPQTERSCRLAGPRLYVSSNNRDSLSQGRLRAGLTQDQIRSEVLSGGTEQRQYRRQQCLNHLKRSSHSASLPSFRHVAVPALKKKLLSSSRFSPSQHTTSTKKFAGQALQFYSPASHTLKAARGVMV
jgi:hypothetical protein